ncbi:MAG TPA: DUF192 domain-containing protein [Candidatus Limnocylindrales bacterium]|nr:DUF192 domain-containing protein [Candidatus Limnocylindrales bacterium]
MDGEGPAPAIAVRNLTRATSLGERITIAATFWGRFLGLMGRPVLGEDEGLWLAGVNNIHMLFMRFPIDCVFVAPEAADGTMTVLALRRSLPPWRGVVWYVRGAAGVFELPVGSIESSATEVGDRITVVEALSA